MTFFVISLFLLAATSISWTLRFCSLTQNKRDFFWIFFGLISLQIGFFSQLGSLLGMLHPIGFFSFQMGVAAINFFTEKRFWKTFFNQKFRFSSILPPNFTYHHLIFWGIIIILTLSFLQQLARPISADDDITYHASRCAYWLQQQTLWHHPTHNERQNVFGIGAELFFFYPLLFTRIELLARLFFWLFFPLAALGVYFLGRELKLNRTIAALGSLLFVSAPIILKNAIGLRSDIAVTLFFLGFIYWMIRGLTDIRIQKAAFFVAGGFFVLTLNCKLTVLAALPALILILLFYAQKWGKKLLLENILSLNLGIIFAALFCGILITLIGNVLYYQHPMGPQAMRQLHKAQASWQQRYIHMSRFGLVLIEPPFLPSKKIRKKVTQWYAQAADFIGASTLLPMENEGSWPGKFELKGATIAERYGLPGLFWLMLLFGLGFQTIREMVLFRKKREFSLPVLAFLLQISLLLGILLICGWRESSKVPHRFLFANYAVACVLMASWVQQFILRRAWFRYAAGGLIFLHLIPIGLSQGDVLYSYSQKSREEFLQTKPLWQISQFLPDYSQVLLICSVRAADYLLFKPERQFSNHVIPWGTKPFQPELMHQLLKNHLITHVIIEAVPAVGFAWNPPLMTQPMLDWLVTEGKFTKVFQDSNGALVFAKNSNEW